MSDWEKRRQVLDGVVTCREMLNPPGYRMTDCSVDCPYYEKRAEKEYVKAMLEDMETLIREQEAGIVRCKDCKHGEIDTAINGVLLSITCDGVKHRPDWFCADGERR